MTSESILQNAYAIAFCDHILPELVSFGEAPWVILLMTENSNRDAECPSGMEFFPSMATVQLVREVHSISSAVQFFYK